MGVTVRTLNPTRMACITFMFCTVTAIASAQTFTTLVSLNGTDDGELPVGGLVQATNGAFYGTTNAGGLGCGTVFKITPRGALTSLYSFCSRPNGADGANPSAGLAQGTDGNFYGITSGDTTSVICGSVICGTAFDITIAGTLTTLHSFGFIDGETPAGALMQATNGRFYGTTLEGGTFNSGTVFSLGVGLGPFVKTEPTFGKVGAAVTILGNSLKDTSSVIFNGTAATFTVVSNTEIRTTVPAGATSGPVEVTTPRRKFGSQVEFHVKR